MFNPDDSIIIMINYDNMFFKNVFSKMEFIMGIDYLNSYSKKFNVPFLFTQRDLNYNITNEKLDNFRNSMNKRRLNNRAPESNMDGKFIDEFNKKIIPENIIKTFKEDIFYHTNIEDILRGYKRNTLLMCGFFTDTDIFVSSFESYVREFNTYVVSDASSTYSERLYFQSLEMIAQILPVIDTRDMEKYF